ncbi:alpha/beta fold hydrolase [Streptomyces sp. NPDC003691]
MRYSTLATLAAGIGVAASLITPVAAPAGAAPSRAPDGLKWELCRDVTADWLHPADSRSECAFVSVPLDYADPQGRQIKIAVSRVKATGKRTGAMFTNPGGPGLYGTPVPYELLETHLGPMNEELDFIGIDTRGTGYSTQMSCEMTEPPPGETEKGRFERYADERRACIAKDRPLALSITMENAARDMDRVREVLGFQKINFYGNSGGTVLGAVYRSMFDKRVNRMWVDSVMYPTGVNEAIKAQEAQYYAAYRRFFEWLSERHATYRFGDSPRKVESALKALMSKVGRENFIPLLSVNLEALPEVWKRSAAKLAELRDDGPQGRSKPKQVNQKSLGWGERGSNYGFTNEAFICNASAEGRTYSDLIRLRKERERKYPFARHANESWISECAAWPVGKPWDLKPGKSQLQLSGHKFEDPTPYPWAKMMQKKVGGSLLTVMDAGHSSLKLKETACGSKIVDFFRNGTAAKGSCPGSPVEEAGPPGPAGNLAGTVKLDNCSASLVRPRTARDEDKALLLTNGHCHPERRPNPGEVISGAGAPIGGSVLSPAGRELGPVTGKTVYATMTGTDVLLAELDSTYAEIRQKYKVEAFPLATSGPVAGQNIKVASSYLDSVWSCRAEAVIPTLKEGDYTSADAIRYAKECDTKPGSSGSPVVDAGTGELVGEQHQQP